MKLNTAPDPIPSLFSTFEIMSRNGIRPDLPCLPQYSRAGALMLVEPAQYHGHVSNAVLPKRRQIAASPNRNLALIESGLQANGGDNPVEFQFRGDDEPAGLLD